MDQMEETLGDVVASVGILYGDQMYENAVGMAVTRQTCLWPREVAELGDPMNRV